MQNNRLAERTDKVNLVVVVPAYNEEDNIGIFLDRIQTLPGHLHLRQIIVVDDGSVDKTREIALSYAAQLPVKVVSYDGNQGVGQAFRTGFAASLEVASPDDVIITIEADNTGDLGILPTMIRRIKEGGDLALASCYAPGGGVRGSDWFRIYLSKAANLILKVAYPQLKVATYSSFYRAYRPEILRRALEYYDDHFIEEPGFVCMVEVLVKVNRLTDRISEVPMILSIDERIGRSKMRIFKTIADYLRFITRDVVCRGNTKAGKE
jgi:dolichol-phosphate mannosyltransferase